MKNKLIKILVFALILAFFGALSLYKIQLPTDDLGRHIINGKMVLEGKFNVLSSNFYSSDNAEFPFINHTWLSGVVFYLLHKTVGFGGMVVFKVILLLSAFVLLFFASLRKADFWVVAFFSFPAILILAERTGLRPEIFSYFFIAVYLYLLMDLEKHPERQRIFWLVPLQLLWVNLHLFFLIGIMLVAGLLAEKIILNYKKLKVSMLVKKLAMLLPLLVLASIINPNGLGGFLFPFHVFANYGFEVAENRSLADFLRVEPPWEKYAIRHFGIF